MKIAYVGNRKNLASDGKSFNTENHIALTLEKLGQTVDFIQEDEIQPGTLANRVKGADLFLWTRTWQGKEAKVHSSDLEAIGESGITTVSFHLDKYTGIERNGGIGIDTFWETDYVFSPEGSTQSKIIFKEHGINHHYLPAGVYEDECYLAKSEIKYMHDIVFVGGGKEYQHKEWPYRSKLITWLEDTYGSRFKKYGWPEESIRGEELNKLYASCKVVIGDSLCKDFVDSYYFSDRVFETTGRGGFIITPYIPGMTDHFVDRKEIVFYAFDNFVQLKNLIDYYIKHNEERQAVRLAGHIRTKTTNTYTQRLMEMFSVLENEEAI